MLLHPPIVRGPSKANRPSVSAHQLLLLPQGIPRGAFFTSRNIAERPSFLEVCALGAPLSMKRTRSIIPLVAGRFCTCKRTLDGRFTTGISGITDGSFAKLTYFETPKYLARCSKPAPRSNREESQGLLPAHRRQQHPKPTTGLLLESDNPLPQLDLIAGGSGRIAGAESVTETAEAFRITMLDDGETVRCRCCLLLSIQPTRRHGLRLSVSVHLSV